MSEVVEAANCDRGPQSSLLVAGFNGSEGARGAPRAVKSSS
jgi:hypothetical protein